MTTGVKPHESEIAIALDFANLPALACEIKVLKFNFVISPLSRPFQCLGPPTVT